MIQLAKCIEDTHRSDPKSGICPDCQNKMLNSMPSTYINFSKGVELFENEQFEEALECFNGAEIPPVCLQKQKESNEFQNQTHYQQDDVLLRQQEFEKALQIIEKALINNENPEIFYKKGTILVGLHRVQEAIQSFIMTQKKGYDFDQT